MRARLKSLDLDPDPATLPSGPAEFSLLARLYVGPLDGPGEESFDITVCTPEWLSEQCRAHGGVYNPRHHLVVTLETFDKQALHSWLEARVAEVEGASWHEVGERLGRLGYWEFEDYTLERHAASAHSAANECAGRRAYLDGHCRGRVVHGRTVEIQTLERPPVVASLHEDLLGGQEDDPFGLDRAGMAAAERLFAEYWGGPLNRKRWPIRS